MWNEQSLSGASPSPVTPPLQSDARCRFGSLQHFVWQNKCYVFSWTELVICFAARSHHLPPPSTWGRTAASASATGVIIDSSSYIRPSLQYYHPNLCFFSAIRLSPSERLFHTWRKQQLFYRSNWQPCGLGQRAEKGWDAAQTACAAAKGCGCTRGVFWL